MSWDEISDAEETGWGEPICQARHCPVDASGRCDYPDCMGIAALENERYAEMQAESLAAADLDPDWPAVYE